MKWLSRLVKKDQTSIPLEDLEGRLSVLEETVEEHHKHLGAIQQALWRIEKKQSRWLEALGINPRAEDPEGAVKVASQQPPVLEGMAGDELEGQPVV